MALELVGAVGIKVRPDARRFREEAKREILDELRDLEAKVRVNIKPDVHTNKADAQRALDDAFGDVKTIRPTLRVDPIVDERAARSLEDALDEQLGSPHAKRISLDAGEALEELGRLGESLDDAESALSRLPGALDATEESYRQVFADMDKDVVRHGHIVNALESDIADLTRSLDSNRSAAEAHSRQLREDERELARMREQRISAESKIAALREQQAKHTGAGSGPARAAIQQQINAEREILTTLRRQTAEQSKAVTASRRLATEAERTVKADEKALKAKREALRKENVLQTDTLKLQQEKTKEHADAVGQLREQITLAEEQRRQAEHGIALQNEILKSHAKTTDELERTALQFDPLFQKLNEWKLRVKELGSLELMDAGTVKDYYSLLREEHQSMTESQIADLREYGRRQEDLVRRRQQIMSESNELRSIFSTDGLKALGDQATRTFEKIGRDGRRAMAKIYTEQTLRIDPKLDQDGLRRQLALLESALQATRAGHVEVNAVLNERNLMRQIREVQRRVNHGNHRINLPFELGAKNYLLAQKDWLAGTAKAVAGLSIMGRIADDFRNTAMNMDKLALSAAAATVKVGSLVSVLGAGVGSAAVIASDLGKLSGGLLMLPTLTFAAGAGIYSFVKGFKNFATAIKDGGSALSGLPKPAQRAALAVKELGEQLDDVMQPAFWRGVGNDMAKAVDDITRPFVKGMKATSEAMGTWVAGASRAFSTFARSGMMGKAFEGMNKGLREMGKAVEPALNAILRIGGAGARHFPALGRAADDAARRFERWSKINDENGNFDLWIKNAAKSLKQLGSITSSTVSVVRSLGQAARAAGLPGLGELASGMEKVSAAARAPFFQGHMTRVFTGMKNAAAGLAEGLGSIGVGLLKQSPLIESSLTRLGTVTSNIGNAIGSSLGSPRLVAGINKLFDDLVGGSEQVARLMPLVANGLGDFASIAGEVVKGGLNIGTAFMEAWDRSQNLTSSIERLIPVLSNAVAGFVRLIHGPIGLLADGLSTLIDGFLALPSPIQAAAVALGLMGVAAFKVNNYLLTMRTGAGVGAHAFDRLSSSLTGAERRFVGVTGGLNQVGHAVRGIPGAVNAASGSVGGFMNQLRNGPGVTSMFRNAMGGLVGFLGGPWGLAFAAAGVAATILGTNIAQRSAKMKADIDAISPTLDRFGSTTTKTFETVAESLNNAEVKFPFKSLSKEADTAGEALQRVGVSSSDVAKMMGKDRGEYDRLSQALVDLRSRGVDQIDTAQKRRAAEERVAEILGISTDAAKENARGLAEAGSEMNRQAEAADKARARHDALGDSFKSVSGNTKSLNDAMRILGDNSMTAADKVTGLKDAIDQYNGKAMTAAESEARFHESMDQTAKVAQDLRAKFGSLSGVLKDNGTAIDTSSEAGRGLLSVLRENSSASLEHALSLRDQGASAKDVSAALASGRKEFISNAQAMGISSEAAGKLYDSMAAIPDEIKKYISIEGGDKALATAEKLSKQLGVSFDGKEYMAWIAADPSRAERAKNDADGLFREWVNETWLAQLGLDAGNVEGIMKRSLDQGKTWDGASFMAWLRADSANVKLAKTDADKAIEEFYNSKHAPKEVKADASQAKREIAEVDKKLKDAKNTEEIKVALSADSKEFDSIIDAAKQKGTEIRDPEAFKAFIDANSERFLSTKASVDDILNEWKMQQNNTNLGADDQASPKVDEAGRKVGDFANQASEATLGAKDSTGQGLGLARLNLDTNWVGKTFSAVLDAGTGMVGKALGVARGLGDIWRGMRPSTDFGGTASGAGRAKGVASGFANLWSRMFPSTDFRGTAAGASRAKGSAFGYAALWRSLAPSTDFKGTSVGANAARIAAGLYAGAWRATRPTTDFRGTAVGASSAAGTARGYAYSWASQRPQAQFTGNARGAWAALSSAISAGLAWAGRVFSARFGGRHADGGLHGSVNANGAVFPQIKVQAFASGGFANRERRLIAQAQASARKENHVAQIARPTTPFRVWAEPETGGEAYIPLAESKRARSTRIWEETGNRLQVNWKAYAEGGGSGGRASARGSASSSEVSRGGVNINVTNHYPQAEPTSTTTNRSLQMAAALL